MAENESEPVPVEEVEQEVPQTPDEYLDNSDRPVIELFVKAAVDKMKNGGCPICHRYFLVFYVLRERGLIDLVVTTFLPELPPKEVLAFSTGKHFPLVKVHKGVDAKGQNMTGFDCDTVDEIEKLLDRFDCDDINGKQLSSKELEAERTFADLYTKFKMMIKNIGDEKPVTRILQRVNDFLQENDHNTFLVGDRLARADCYFLPIVQHVRVAGKAYSNYEIPTHMTYLWRYLGRVYDTDAFKESCPADREIITHYVDKVPQRREMRNDKSKLMGEQRTFSIPQPSNGAVE